MAEDTKYADSPIAAIFPFSEDLVFAIRGYCYLIVKSPPHGKHFSGALCSDMRYSSGASNFSGFSAVTHLGVVSWRYAMILILSAMISFLVGFHVVTGPLVSPVLSQT